MVLTEHSIFAAISLLDLPVPRRTSTRISVLVSATGEPPLAVGHLAQALEQLAHHLLRDHHAVVGEGLEGVDELGCGQHLREVAVGAGLNRLHDVRLVLVGGQDQHVRVGHSLRISRVAATPSR